jgi:hypothetical protein
MSQPQPQPQDDYYHVSDTSEDEAGHDKEDVSDIIKHINLDAIQRLVSAQNIEAEPDVPNFFEDQQQGYNKYIPFWITPRLKSYPLRHPALRPGDI